MITNLSAKLYIEVDLLCIFVLGLLAFKTHKSCFAINQKRYFKTVLLCHIIFSATDLSFVFNNGLIPLMEVFPNHGILISYVLNSLNVIFSGMTGLTWLLFSQMMQGDYIVHDKRKWLITLLPLIVIVLLTVTTRYTHFMFYVTEEGEYVRGSGYIVQMILSYGYILYGTFLSLRRMKNANSLQEKRASRTIAFFIIAPICFGIVQLFFPNMQVLFIGTVLALLSVYISLQEMQILTDPLTGLNNRMLLDQKIQAAIQNQNGKYDLYLMMIDANHFKKINDVYGHTMGDKVLVLIADVLRKTCGTADFLCRWGGDEFVLLHRAAHGDDCKQLVQGINETLATCHMPFSVSVSVGICKYTPKMKDLNEFMNAVDKEMYRVKSIQHSER